MRKSFFAIAMLALLNVLSTSAIGSMIVRPMPPRVDFVQGRETDACLQLGTTLLRTKPIGVDGSTYKTDNVFALDVHNGCAFNIVVSSVITANSPDAELVATPVLVQMNMRRFLLNTAGAECSASATYKFFNIIYGYTVGLFTAERDIIRDYPAPECKSVFVRRGDYIHIAVPLERLFRISGQTESGPFTIEGKFVFSKRPMDFKSFQELHPDLPVLNPPASHTSAPEYQSRSAR